MGQGVSEAEYLPNTINPWLEQPRFQTWLFAAFAIIALVLTAIGLYAVASFEVSLRRYELGVRMALGATASEIRRVVMVHALRPVLLGVGLGCLGCWWAGRFLQALLFEVDVHEPFMYVLVAVLLVVTAAIAAWLPARRASRTDPAAVLRAQ
jgi:ABC-type antimicrobial peptide transport system permease subunit